MRYFLENDILKAEFDSFGAELKSVLRKDNYREYMWYGNKAFWPRTSPVLFPMVGNAKNSVYTWQGKQYHIGSHGFARDMEHELISDDGNEIWFELRENEETLGCYPFRFILNIGYKLDEDRVIVMWKVKNPSDDTMYFSIGAHPAFLCPVQGEKSKTGYYLAFDGLGELHHHGNIKGRGIAVREDICIPLEEGRVMITEDFFDRCTYMVENRQTGRVAIETPEKKRIVQVDFDTPLFAIWSPEGKNAPFICIEPWFGRSDYEDFEGDFSQRDHTQRLEAGKVFESSYSMKFFRL